MPGVEPFLHWINDISKYETGGCFVHGQQKAAALFGCRRLLARFYFRSDSARRSNWVQMTFHIRESRSRSQMDWRFCRHGCHHHAVSERQTAEPEWCWHSSSPFLVKRRKRAFQSWLLPLLIAPIWDTLQSTPLSNQSLYDTIGHTGPVSESDHFIPCTLPRATGVALNPPDRYPKK